MMRALFILLFLFSSNLFLLANTQTNTQASTQVDIETHIEDSRVNYKDGEKLSYIIHYGFLRAGKATLSINKGKYKGKEVMHLKMQAKTVGFANTLYKIRDTYESFVDADNGLPVMAIRDIKEGHYRKNNVITFDREKNIATSKLTGKHSVPVNIQDILSAFYLARDKYFNDKMIVGDIISIQTFFSDELFPLQIRFLGYESIKSKVGHIRCYKFIPVTQKGRAFKNSDGMTLWVSADANKYPIRAQFDLMMGSVRCDLVDYNAYRKRK